jgi:hypothetical protein
MEKRFSLLIGCLWLLVALVDNVSAQATLTKPLIVDPNAPSEDQVTNVAAISKVLISEPPSASVETPDPSETDAIAGMLDASPAAADEGSTPAAPAGGDSSSESTDGSDSTSEEGGSSDSTSQENQSAIEKEIKLLTSLVEHGKAIAAALPEKEKRLNELAAQLNAAKAGELAKGAEAKLAEQELLLKEIQLKIQALKKKLEDLETTETKLTASIDKVRRAVNTNEEVTHELNQEAAKASVGVDASTGEAAAAEGAPAAVEAAPAAALIDASVDAASKEARAVLHKIGGFRSRHH